MTELPGPDAQPTIVAAAVQAPSAFLDRRAGVERTCRWIEEAATAGARLVVFPESFVPGHPLWLHFWSSNDRRSVAAYERLFANALTVPGPELDAVAETAARCGTAVVLGVTEKRPGSTGTLYNTQVFLGRDGTLLGKHQKLVPTVREKIVHAPGGGEFLDTFDAGFGRVGGLICGENSNPLASYALQALGETVHAASWPPFMGFSSAAEVVGFVSRSLAYSGHVWVVNAVGLVGDDFFELMGGDVEDREAVRGRSGGSSIVDPHGRVVAGPMGPGEEGLLLAELDLGLAVRAKLSHDFTGHYNRFDVFELRLNRRARPPLVVDDGDETL